MLKILVVALVSVVVIVGLHGAALAIDYQCHLPIVTSSTLNNGISSIETSRDDTVDFTINVSRDGDFALIDGFRFLILKGPGFLAFYGVLNAAANGLDIITIYDAKVGGAQFTVESRQVTILMQPTASQLVGNCVQSG